MILHRRARPGWYTQWVARPTEVEASEQGTDLCWGFFWGMVTWRRWFGSCSTKGSGSARRSVSHSQWEALSLSARRDLCFSLHWLNSSRSICAIYTMIRWTDFCSLQWWRSCLILKKFLLFRDMYAYALENLRVDKNPHSWHSHQTSTHSEILAPCTSWYRASHYTTTRF